MPPQTSFPQPDDAQALIRELGQPPAPAAPVSGRFQESVARRSWRRLVPMTTIGGGLLAVGFVVVMFARADSQAPAAPLPPTVPQTSPESAAAPAPATPVQGDLTGDGKVTVADIKTLQGKWGTSDASADLDGDGKVGKNDLAALVALWNKDFFK